MALTVITDEQTQDQTQEQTQQEQEQTLAQPQTKAQQKQEQKQGRLVKVKLNDLRLDLGTQFRPWLSQEKAEQYGQSYLDGEPLPRILVYDVAGVGLVLVGGFHRVAGARMVKLKELPAKVVQGSLQDAIGAALRENLTHGVDRCDVTKERVVDTALDHPDYRDLPTNTIARMLKVSWALVERRRAERQGRAAKGQSTRVTQTKDLPSTSTPAPAPSPAPAAPHAREAGARPEDDALEADDSDEALEVADSDEALDAEREALRRQQQEREEAEFLASLGSEQGGIRDRLGPGPRRVFDTDALIYFRLMKSPAFQSFRIATERLLGDHKVGHHGPLHGELSWLIRMKHPREWLVCRKCGGSGQAHLKFCHTCRGDGYGIA